MYLVRMLSRCEDVDGCWVWQGCKTDEGYGRIHYIGKTVYTHRLMYAIMVGPIKPGYEIDHRKQCRNPSCIRPSHLRQVTAEEHAASDHRGVHKTW